MGNKKIRLTAFLLIPVFIIIKHIINIGKYENQILMLIVMTAIITLFMVYTYGKVKPSKLAVSFLTITAFFIGSIFVHKIINGLYFDSIFSEVGTDSEESLLLTCTMNTAYMYTIIRWFAVTVFWTLTIFIIQKICLQKPFSNIWTIIFSIVIIIMMFTINTIILIVFNKYFIENDIQSCINIGNTQSLLENVIYCLYICISLYMSLFYGRKNIIGVNVSHK